MQPGLYYPNIRIRDVEWLKRALIVFPRIYRMIPESYSPWDEKDHTMEFSQVFRGDYPLLCGADLGAPRVREAQIALAQQIALDASSSEFCQRFSKEVALRKKRAGDPGVQLHRYKIGSELVDVLDQAKLGWIPADDVADGDHYVEVHPAMGEAIMSTIAIACAHVHGTSVVAEPAAGKLHECLVAKEIEHVYNAWIHPAKFRAPPAAPTGEAVFDVIVDLHCDVSKLGPSEIAKFGDDREAIDKLLAALQKGASEIRLDLGKERDALLQDYVSDVLNVWNDERRNMSNIAKIAIGESPKSAVDFTKKVVEKAFSPASAGAIAGGLTLNSIWGILAGVAIGLVPTYLEGRKRAQDSPLHFLTTMQKHGVQIKVPLQIKSSHDPDLAAQKGW
ncbi:hypothetical protein ACCS62_28475 [Rhizobium ruizarguesonis]